MAVSPVSAPTTLRYLDGLRGLAAAVVVLHHFAGFFYPAMLSGDAYMAHLNGGVEVAVASTPANILIGGNFAVCLFFVLSGLVLSEKFWRTGGSPEVLRSQACRRYVRLMLPVTFAALVALLLWGLGAYRNTEVAEITLVKRFGEYWPELPGVKQILHDLAVGIPLGGESSYNPVFWTLSIELFGSFVVFALLALFGKVRHRGVVYLVALGLLSVSELNFYYAGFILGVWLNDQRHHGGLLRSGRPWLGIGLLAGAVLLGSFPTADVISVDETLYRFLKPDWLGGERAIQVWHLAGATLLLLAVFALPGLQRGLSSRALRGLGAVSFSLYLLHFLVLGSFSCALFLALQPRLGYHTAVALTGLATVPVLALVSYAMYRLVDLPGIRLAQRLYNQFFRPAAPAPAAAPTVAEALRS
ncbi:acyltransferase family protein [Hymenobacter chitinivorans]|uniref:Peptidoglycan/LPS O-acetylase OafA/YrhL n=1 Tax=Hymenobacter chitinivorans DSM 11115 TaxID=1121954 RepID=A0A2M9BT22_9BACT|nr:acyltransferase [Hymenobacter chitinivorans]PJJ61081.1 peptidoglycan/LPS O-acetylase OafA/YrhL [Hymenobacter chitinivorans DSM 11115]